MGRWVSGKFSVGRWVGGRWFYSNPYPSGSQPARLYDNPKTHKLKSESDKLTFRPIVSSIGSHHYMLAKFLTSMLAPVIPEDHSTKGLIFIVQGNKKGKFHQQVFNIL